MSELSIAVVGDIIVDHHIYEGKRAHFGDSRNRGVRVVLQRGGAALVDRLLWLLINPDEAYPESEKKVSLDSVAGNLNEPEETTRVGNLVFKLPPLERMDPSLHAFAFWKALPTGASRKRFWRPSEAMGFGGQWKEESCELQRDQESCDLLVVSEGGMGFRDEDACWGSLVKSTRRWIVYRATDPVAEGDLWGKLLEWQGKREGIAATDSPESDSNGKNLCLIVSANDLRMRSARISMGLSWEETIQSLMREMADDGALRSLRESSLVLVTLDTDGAILFDFRRGIDAEATATLVFDAGSIEGEFRRQFEGPAFGLMTCMVASVAGQIHRNSEEPDFRLAMEAGLSGMRSLVEEGHGPAELPADGFPAKRLASVIQQPTCRYSSCSFPVRIGPAKASTTDLWSLRNVCQAASSKPEMELAMHVARFGNLALENVPHYRVGALFTADRGEIEVLRTLADLIRNYDDMSRPKKPLSVGVFGPPGAGKSFAVKQLAKGLVKNCQWLEFNLSQFDGPADIVGAFHQVRDAVLRGKLPVAFFDEFDSQEFGWLQHLLAPMQDGAFQEGQITHPIGKCVFVFAGGTSWTFETFGPPNPDELNSGGAEDSGISIEAEKAYRSFILAKGPDFKSRLDGFLDVQGPNQRKIPVAQNVGQPAGSMPAERVTVSGREFVVDPADTYFPVRRALMLRSQLKCGSSEVLDIDEALLGALLGVKAYRHGARSLEKVLEPLSAVRPGKLVRSLLASDYRLRMHIVDERGIDALLAEQDLKISQRPKPEEIEESPIATAAGWIHERWRREKRRKGPIKEVWLDVPWAELGEKPSNYGNGAEDQEKWPERRDQANYAKASSQAAVVRIPAVLRCVGLNVVPLGNGESWSPESRAQVRQFIERRLDVIAQEEHRQWMAFHFDDGWQYDKHTDKKAKKHSCLVDYEKLSDPDKNFDRMQVRDYPMLAGILNCRIDFIP